MSEKSFKKGDRVKCVDSRGTNLVVGGVYTVVDQNSSNFLVVLEGMYGLSRFERVPELKNTRAEEIAELEARLVVLKHGDAVDARKATVDKVCEHIKSKINHTNYHEASYQCMVDGQIIELVIGSPE